ncbi:hypothetical protein MA16_Dca001766 [Dendrobium catenatum]|uniref:DUF3475 domain-containing protein n=1 Tax=Dendrobium catenatum TaxID=906689 RepID=A0A2I0XDF0_9ASPA|nr:hypothetical protein MA16_Dca001766 [Dendrobium catenatum]
MSRAIHLHCSLSDGEISNLHHEILSSPALRSLISPYENHLLAVAVAEKLNKLNRTAADASRRCFSGQMQEITCQGRFRNLLRWWSLELEAKKPATDRSRERNELTRGKAK